MERPSLSIATGTSMFPEGNTFVLVVTTICSVFLYTVSYDYGLPFDKTIKFLYIINRALHSLCVISNDSIQKLSVLLFVNPVM